jgi:hypothetical protein
MMCLGVGENDLVFDPEKNKWVHMYVNGKMRPVEAVPGMEGGDKGDDGGGEFKFDICDIL